MNYRPPNKQEPNLAKRGKRETPDDGPIGVDPETLRQDIERYSALIANTKEVVERNVSQPLQLSRFGFVNALLRVLSRRKG